MKQNRNEEERIKDNLTGERAVPVGTGVGGLAMATAGAAVGGLGAIAAGATAGSFAGPIGTAVGAAIGAVIGTALERNAEQKSNPVIESSESEQTTESRDHGLTIKDFSPPQQQALLDLIVLAMYADGIAASSEENLVRRLITLQGIPSENNRGHYDSAVSRAREHLKSPEKAAARARELMQNFTTVEEQWLVQEILQDFLGSDGGIGPEETELLSATKSSGKR